MNSNRYYAISLIAIFFLASPTVCDAQEWARKMFIGDSTHDFGIVAADSDVVHRFEFKNLYEEDLHIASVSTSCNCTIVSVDKRDLKTHETGAVIARFNTRAFRGQKQATLTVRIDRPYYAEVQLIVRGNIRGNVAFEPGSIQFGDVKQGAKSDKSITVIHRGNNNWRITDVTSLFPKDRIKVGLRERLRANGQVQYEMVVQLQDNVKPGYVQGELHIETNEGNRIRYPLVFNGRVVAPLQLSPAIMPLGPISPGTVVEKKILLKADTPFRVTSIVSSDNCLQIEQPNVPKKLHIIHVKYTAGDTVGQHHCQAEIRTDLGQEVTIFKTIATVER